MSKKYQYGDLFWIQTELCINYGTSYNEAMSQIVLYQPQLLWPTDWAALFGREAPFVIEIGFGGGHFLVDLAQKRPFQNILGVEISIPSIQRAERKIRNLSLTNVKILQTDARFLLQLLCPPNGIQEVYINFPDPWRKAAHHDRRLINLEFLHLLATRMANNGTLDIANRSCRLSRRYYRNFGTNSLL